MISERELDVLTRKTIQECREYLNSRGLYYTITESEVYQNYFTVVEISCCGISLYLGLDRTPHQHWILKGLNTLDIDSGELNSLKVVLVKFYKQISKTRSLVYKEYLLDNLENIG